MVVNRNQNVVAIIGTGDIAHPRFRTEDKGRVICSRSTLIRCVELLSISEFNVGVVDANAKGSFLVMIFQKEIGMFTHRRDAI